MKKYFGCLLAVFVLLAGCTTTFPSSPTPTVSAVPACPLAPAVAPTRPAVIPDYTALDKTTNLHMTGTPVDIDLATYRLHVTGLVDRPLSLSYDELRCLPKVTATPTLICMGFFTDIATWSGVPLMHILGLAGIQASAKEIIFVAADGLQTHIPIADALREENYLAYEWNGEPLPVLHGFPLRAVMPSMLGYAWTKWLVEIKVK